MENQNEHPQEDVVVEEETTTEVPEEQEPADDTVVLKKSDFTKMQRKAIAYDAKKKEPISIINENPVDSVDLIKLGKKLQDYSDSELDFVVDYAKSKKPEDVLKALENPYVQAGIQAQREKTERERVLTPNGAQGEFDKPKSFVDQLNSAKSLREKEDLLRAKGLYKDPRRRDDTVGILR